MFKLPHTAFISHASKIMLKILQARLQWYMNGELPDVQAEVRKGRGTRGQFVNIYWIIKKAREFQKFIYFCFYWLHQNLWLCGSQTVENYWRDGNTRAPDQPPEKSVCEVKKQQLELDREQQTSSKSEKEYVEAILSPCLFNLSAEYIMQNARLDEAQAGIKIARRNINNLRYADDTTLMAESDELESLLMKVKEESEKVGLKLNIQKTNIMASGPIISWQINGETMETVTLFSWAPKSLQIVTAALKLKDTYSLEENYDQPKLHIKKQRHYFASKRSSSQNYGFSSSHVWMWELDYKESWALKNW